MDLIHLAMMAQGDATSGLTGWERLIFGAMGTVVGLLGCYVVLEMLARGRLKEAKKEASRTIEEAKSEAEVVRRSAQVEAKDEYLKGQENLRKPADLEGGQARGLHYSICDQ